MAIAVEMPPEIEQQLRVDWPELERHALEAFVVEAYRRKRVGVHTAGTLLGLADRRDTIRFLAGRGVYPNYDLEDLEQDRRTLAELLTPSSYGAAQRTSA